MCLQRSRLHGQMDQWLDSCGRDINHCFVFLMFTFNKPVSSGVLPGSIFSIFEEMKKEDGYFL